MNYALIENNIVTNTIWLSQTNAHKFPNAIYYGEIPVAIGDMYDGEHFYRNGKRVLTYLEELEEELEDMREALKVLGVITTKEQEEI